MLYCLIPAYNTPAIESYIMYKGKVVGNVEKRAGNKKHIYIHSVCKRDSCSDNLDNDIQDMLTFIIGFQPGPFHRENSLVLGLIYLDGPVLSITSEKQPDGQYHLYQEAPSTYRITLGKYDTYEEAEQHGKRIAISLIEAHIDKLETQIKSLT